MSLTGRVKICGITRAEDAEAAVRCGAVAIGFVFWPTSPRVVQADTARAIGDRLPPFVARVGVFVNAAPDLVDRTARLAGLDVVQLHGDEAVADYLPIGRRLIKAVTLESEADVDKAAALPDAVLPLVDARDPVRRGGTGSTAEWKWAASLAARRNIVLAGGLDAGNVRSALLQVRPWAIDVSSGVELSPGIKSAARREALFDAGVASRRGRE
jgi:phosphoribosylanthranilate isomerase